MKFKMLLHVEPKALFILLSIVRKTTKFTPWLNKMYESDSMFLLALKWGLSKEENKIKKLLL